MTMKCVAASSNWPGPNSSPAKSGRMNCAPLPVVPCSTSTTFCDLALGVTPRLRRWSGSGCVISRQRLAGGEARSS